MNQNTIQKWMLIFGPVISIMMILFMDLEPGRPEVTRMAAVALLMAMWWVTEALPLAATALLPVALFPLLGIMNGKTVAPIYFNHIIFLFIGGFIMALAMEKWDLHKRIALFILLRFKLKPANILLGFMITTAFLSMWISNTATTMMMVPIALAIILQLEGLLGKASVKKYSIGIFLGLAYSASIGGIATIVGTPPNLSFVRIFNILFPGSPEITFANWFFFAFPLSVCFLIIVWFILSQIFISKKIVFKIDPKIFKNQYRELGPMSSEEKIVLTGFLCLIFLWLFRSDIPLGDFVIPGWSRMFPYASYLNDGTVAITIALILFILPSRSQKGNRIMDWDTASKLPWNIVLLFGGGFALASGFKETGLSNLLGSQLGGVGNLHPVLIVAVICIFVTFLTELTSNTATAEMLLPILGGLAIAIKVNPLFLMIPATLSCSFAFMLPVATPPNAIIFGTNRVTIMDMAKTGIWINLIGVVLITLLIFSFGNWVFGIDVAHIPDWMMKGK
ncbi:MAG: SLC13/DASS family transporter [Candidatus Marinimicrobia bacterium]|nr:SLC13/DASS family transporter [Candidatus Neomarinimicrobiota bacterium]